MKRMIGFGGFFREIIDAIPNIDYICVDVANGYSESFVEFVRLVRKEFPDKTIFVLNNRIY
jgi:GMP reductase